MLNPYEVLNISPEATDEEIQAAFDALQMQCYAKLRDPATHAESIEKIKQLTQAKETLMNRRLRTQYEEESASPATIKHNPWRRFFARWADVILFFTVYYLLYLYASNYLFFENTRLAIEAAIAGLLLFAVIDTIVLAIFASTPGKWMFSMKIAGPEGAKPKAASLIKRNLLALTAGCGLFVLPITIVTMLIQFMKQKKSESDVPTLWDTASGTAIEYGDVRPKRLWLLVPFLVAIIVYLITLLS